MSMIVAMGWLFAIGCLVGVIAGRASRGPRPTRFRLLNKPRKTRLSVLVPPGPPPRLIPGDSPNATRKRPAYEPVARQTQPGAARAGVVDYIAAFAQSGEEEARVDYLLVPDDDPAEASAEGAVRDPDSAD